jgi:trehalose 6-phosphate synthase
MARLIIVANRVPTPDERGNPRAGGLAIALAEALVPGSLWLGWSGERVEQAAATEPHVVEDQGITYATIDFSEADYRAFYLGFANGTLWPLLHMMPGLTTYHREEYAGYRRVNRAFAEALAGLAGPDDLIWIHDYQLLAVAEELRALGLQNRIGFFLHIPFAPPEIFRILPPAAALLRALGACDVIGFQTECDRAQFLDCIRELLGVAPNANGRFSINGHESRTVVTPVGIDSHSFSRLSARAVRRAETKRVTESLAGRALMIGVDRLDYTKGLPGRFEAYGRFLASYPQHKRKISYLQIAAPTRGEVGHYQALRDELDHKTGTINGMHSDFDWVPLRYMTRTVSRTAIAGLYRVARIGLVTPLRDGMNLVAKEYIAAQNPASPGVLILSCFAGAADELAEALLVNPFDVDEVAAAIHTGLIMPEEERQARHAGLLARVQASSAAAYCAGFTAFLADRSPQQSWRNASCA